MSSEHEKILKFSDGMPSESVSKDATTRRSDMLTRDMIDPNTDEILSYDQGIDDLGDYVPISDGNIRSILARIDKEGDEKVPSEQLGKLMEVMACDILGYEHGDPNVMLSNLLRTSYTFNDDVIDVWRDKLVRFYDVRKDETPQDAEGVLRLCLVLNSQGKKNRKNLYNEMSASASKMEFNVTSKPPESLSTKLKRLQGISMTPSSTQQGFLPTILLAKHRDGPSRFDNLARTAN